jgi:uncharacterized protein
MSVFTQFLIGLLFGGGLVIAGMSDPAKVLSFLDVATIANGTWDPSLAFVMAGGVITTFIGYKLVLKQQRPIFATAFSLPTKTDFDMPLVSGAAIFGIGWGLGGFCPGPAFTALGTGNTPAVLFVVAMLAGMFAARTLTQKQQPFAKAN